MRCFPCWRQAAKHGNPGTKEKENYGRNRVELDAWPHPGKITTTKVATEEIEGRRRHCITASQAESATQYAEQAAFEQYLR